MLKPRCQSSRTPRGVLVGVLGVLVLAAVCGAARAQQPPTRAVPQSKAQIHLSFAPVVRKVAPAVVNIYARKVETRTHSPLFDDPFLRRFFGEDFAFGDRPRREVRNSLGSGVIVGAKGIIVTNVHVVRGAEEIRVVLNDGREFDARLELSDPQTDLAVLRIEPGGARLPFLEFADSDALEVGDLVLAIGNPFGVGQTVTSGIVSALARTAVGATDYRFFIQTDAAINPGNSGGALVTMDGRLAGINTALFSRSGGSNGIGFAIPSAMVRTVVAGLGTGARVLRPWFGATGQRVSASIAGSIGLARPRGVILNHIHPAGPAARAGLRVGDVVLAVNGHEVRDAQALRFRFATLPVGGSAELTVLRNGREHPVRIALLAPPENPPRHRTRLGGPHPLSGATVANLSPALADELSLPLDTEGVIVLAVARRSPASRAGLNKGDIIRAVNDTAVKSVAQLRRALEASEGMAHWRLTFERNGRTLAMAISGIGR